MSWNGAGVFNRLFNWQADTAAGIDITASRMDSDTTDITANGFANTLTRDGQGSATANQPMNGFRHTNVGNAQIATDYLSLGQYQLGEAINWSTDSGSADAIATTYTPALASLTEGQLCFVRAANANLTTTPTFAPSALTAHTITKAGGAALIPGDIKANQELILRYNLSSTRWELCNPQFAAFNPQASNTNWVVAGGSADAITATYAPAITALVDGMLCFFRASTANATTTPTFAPNGLTAHTITKKGGIALAAGDIPGGLSEVILRYNLANTVWELLNPATQFTGMNAPLNLQVNATVGSNLLTIAIKDSNGNDPSLGSPVPIVFRSPTAASGAPVLRYIFGALSISTNSTGATLGSTNTTPFRLWVVAFDNGGTVVLGLINCSTATQIFALNETAVQTSVAVSGGATSAGVFYTPNGTTVTAKSIRILGYVEYNAGLVTAGTYNIPPTAIQLFGPGVKKPGDIVQSIYKTTTTTTAVSSTTIITTSLAQAITPTSAVNLIKVAANGSVDVGGNGVILQLGRNSNANLIGGTQKLGVSGGQYSVAFMAVDAPGTVSSTTYGVYFGLNSGTLATTWLGTTNDGGFTPQGAMTIDEIMG